MADAEDDITSCPVCFEDYVENGNHVPRILPCYHTVCEKCLGELLCDDSIDCPECRVSHITGKGVKVFPQNRYIVTHMRKRHEKEEPKSGQLKGKLESTAKDLNTHREKFLAAKEELEKQNATVVSKITARRDLVMRVVSRRFEKLLQETTNQIEEVNNSITEEVAIIDENLVLLDSLKITTEDESNDDEISSRLETVKGIAKQAKLNSAKERKYKKFDYTESQATVEDVKKLSGLLTEKETTVVIREGSPILEDVKPAETVDESGDAPRSQEELDSFAPEPSPVSAVKRKPTQFTCKVNQSIGTEFFHVISISQVTESRIVVCGQERGQYKLTMYDLQDEDLCSIALKEEPGGICKIRVAGKQAIAVSYPKKLMIDFHDANNLSNLLCRCPVEPPLNMCAASTSMLLYQDKVCHVVRWLDCRTYIPKHVPGNKVTALQHNWVRSICCVESGNKQLLVTSHFSSTFDKKVKSGLKAYNTENSEVEWSVTGKVPGMQAPMSSWGLTTDGRGHLYVCDINNMCVQVFSVDGVYIGPILKQGEYGLGEPWLLCWCGNISSLVVSHLHVLQQGQQNEISIINVSKVDSTPRSGGSKITAMRGRGRGRAMPRKTEAF